MRGARTCVIAGVVACLVAINAGPARADPVSVGSAIRLYTGPGSGSYGGGEFYADVVPFGASGEFDFITFCLQRNEYFTPGATMYVGGIGESTVSGNDPISEETAYLYTQFRGNTLANYDTSTSASYKASATSLQLAFWFLEGEVTRNAAGAFVDAYTNAVLGTNVGADAYIQLAQNTVAGGGWSGIGEVRVLNLFGSYKNGVFTGDKQDQLTLADVPEPGTLALLLVGGVIGLVRSRRRIVHR